MGVIEPSPCRDALLGEIIANGVAYGTAERPILSRDGRTGTRWVMSFLGVGLREPWLSMASDLLLDALKGFGARQVATMGMAATSLLAGCVLRSGGAYSALLVRPEPKAHGSGRQIEGVPDRAAPVVIIDDAIGTGHSALECARILEAEGFEVEGVIALVRFTYDSGYALLEEHGYRVRAIYDLYDDLAPVMEPSCIPAANPWRARDIRWREETVPDGIGPFALARRYLEEAREHRALSRPPTRLAADIAAPGGVWLSARGLSDGAPVARTGVWRFDEEPPVPMPLLLAEACWWLAGIWPAGGPAPEHCGLGLSLIGALTPCEAGEADNDAFALVVRGRERPWQIGSALPRMPGVTGAAHQLRHALFAHGTLRAREPFDLYRATVTKLIEPGAVWPDGGCSARPAPGGDDAMAAAILDRARGMMTGAPVEGAPDLYLFDADYLFLSVQEGDVARACVGARCETTRDLDALIRAAMADPRMAGAAVGALSFQLSVLSGRWSGAVPPAFTPGRDALGLDAPGGESILLPAVAVDENLDAEDFAMLLHAKAGAPAGGAWYRYRAEHWCAGPEGGARPSGASARVAARTVAPGQAAQGWFRWLAGHVAAGTLPAHEQPLSGQRGEAASPALYAEAIRRLRQAAPLLGQPAPPLPFDLLPRSPDLLTLAHAQAAAGGLDARLRAVLATVSPRLDPVGFWRAHEVLDTPDPRAARWRQAPVATFARIVRFCADDAPADAAWLRALVRPDGVVVSNETTVEDTLIAARAAEALAGSPRAQDRAAARRILSGLAGLSLDLGEGCAAVRASVLQSGVRTEQTVAALAAFCRLGEGT